MSELRWCTACKQYKDTTEFYRRGAAYMSECKVCNKLRHLALPRRDRHAENERKRAKRHIATRRLTNCEYCSRYWECCLIVMTAAPLPCCPNSGVTMVRPPASEIQTNWRMSA